MEPLARAVRKSSGLNIESGEVYRAAQLKFAASSMLPLPL